MAHSDHEAQPRGCLGCQALDTLDDPSVIFDDDGRIVFWSRAAATFYGIASEAAVGQMAADLLAGRLVGQARRAEAAHELRAGRQWQTELDQTRADGTPVTVRTTIRPIVDADEKPHYVMFMVDITGDRALAEQRDLLAAAVDQASESVVITDVDGNIEYVNPAFEQVSGYRREEVLGRNPRVLKSGAQGPQFYRRMWSRLVAGEVFRAEFENRRKDGSLYHEVAAISPVRGPDGRTNHYVAVKRDVTHQRTLERRMEREARARAAAMEAIGSLRPGSTAEETARSVASALVEHCDFGPVAIFSFEADDQAITLAATGDHGDELVPRVLPRATSRALVARAIIGPWIEPIETAGASLPGTFDGGMAHAPLWYGGAVVGLLTAATTTNRPDRPAGRLDFLVELGGMIAALLGPALESRRATASSRQRIEAIIEQGAYRSVFQPIVDLASGAVVGHEALTRFDDLTPPDVVFALAQRCGIGLDLEERTIKAALEAAGGLAANLPLHINVSPAMVLDPVRLPRLLRHSGWNVTLEVTEHEPIDDYAAIRDALGRLGSGVELAVDDAGAGFASLRHILELRPNVVKLDRYLVASIDHDPPRQALVAGMVHFAQATGFGLIGEGIETEGERQTLIDLGVRGGQGWLFGRAVPAPDRPTIAVAPTGAPAAASGSGRSRASHRRRMVAGATLKRREAG